MTCRTESKDIGDHEYSVTQWSAEKSMLMKFKLAKVFGAPLAIIASDNVEGGETETLAAGLSKLFETNSPEDLVSLMKSCVVGVARDGRRITDNSFNELFSGDDLIEIYKIFIFVVQVNYSNFFKGQLAEDLLAKMKVK